MQPMWISLFELPGGYYDDNDDYDDVNVIDVDEVVKPMMFKTKHDET